MCAVDIAVEASLEASCLFQSTRSGAWINPRVAFGAPIDHVGNTRAMWLMPTWLREKLLSSINSLLNGDLDNYGARWRVPRPRRCLLPLIVSRCVPCNSGNRALHVPREVPLDCLLRQG